MKKIKSSEKTLDFSKAIRGRFFHLAREGTNVVLSEPDLLQAFPDSEAVNQALRSLKQIAERATH